MRLPADNKPGSYSERDVRVYRPKPGFRFVYTYAEAKNLGAAASTFDFSQVRLVAGGKDHAPALIMGATAGLTVDPRVSIEPARYVVREVVYSIPFAHLPEALLFKEDGKDGIRKPIQMLSGAKKTIAGWKPNASGRPPAAAGEK